jgi:3-hydroxyisobutyrate dehydrogenase
MLAASLSAAVALRTRHFSVDTRVKPAYDETKWKEAPMAKVAFVGLGVMGYPMAGHLAKKGGHAVTVYNRTAAKTEKWVGQHGGKSAPTPREAAVGQDFVMACVGNDHDLREVMLGSDGVFAGMRKGAIVVDHTTASAEIARELYAEARKRGFDFIDAPVSGGQAGAENGVLTVMCGGDAPVFAQAEKVIAAYARACNLIGASGSGQLAKMVNQICIAGIVQGLAEALHFAQKSGLDIEKLIATISKGAAQSWQMENRYKTMAAGKFDFGFAVDWMRKDLAICLTEARRNGAHLPATALVDQFYSEVQAMGGKRWDTSSLIALLQR